MYYMKCKYIWLQKNLSYKSEKVIRILHNSGHVTTFVQLVKRNCSSIVIKGANS